MSLTEAIAQQPAWLTWWVNWLFFGAFLLPLALLVWRQTRITAVVTVLCSALAGAGVLWLYSRMGYVRLLGLPHIVVWTPLALYLWRQIRRSDLPAWPRRILVVIVATLIVSLAFDYVDAIRYLLGDRTPTAMPPAT